MKLTRKLPDNVTLRTLVGSLSDPTEFVRCVFANMRGYYKDCQVRLATDRSGKHPDYMVEMLFYDDDHDGQEIAHPQPIAVFSGRTHTGALVDAENTRRLWSREATKWGDVQALLVELRGPNTHMPRA